MTPQPLVTFPGCHDCEHLRDGPAQLCLDCARPVLARPGSSACSVCSQRVGAGGRCANELCHSQDRRIGRIYAIAYQSGAVRQAIYGYKYGGATGWPAVFGRLLLAWLDETLAVTPPDLIVAHPSFVGPAGQRFAHTEAVVESAACAARARAAACSPWQFDTATPRAIIKTAATLKSADMQAWTKRASALELRAALRVPDPARTSGRHILVYDDVCTTGGQLEAVAACLLDEGFARRVDGVVLGRAPWRGHGLAE